MDVTSQRWDWWRHMRMEKRSQPLCVLGIRVRPRIHNCYSAILIYFKLYELWCWKLLDRYMKITFIGRLRSATPCLDFKYCYSSANAYHCHILIWRMGQLVNYAQGTWCLMHSLHYNTSPFGWQCITKIFDNYSYWLSVYNMTSAF